MLLSKCELYDSKRVKFIKELLSSLGINTPLNKTPLLGPFFF